MKTKKETPELQGPGLSRAVRRRFAKFCLTHGHARDIPRGKVAEKEKPISRMQLAVVTTSWWAQHEVWQPNTQVPGAILTGTDVFEYRDWLERFTPNYDGKRMRHSISIKLMPNTTKEMLQAAWNIGVRTVKIFPAGITHSKEGWNSFRKDMYLPIQWALETGFIVCIHSEEPGDHIDTYGRENYFVLHRFKRLVYTDFPGGRFNLEHISCKRTIDIVGEMPANVTGGLAIQHGVITRNDLLEWKTSDGKTGLNPVNHFRPPAQKHRDMFAIRDVMFRAHLSPYRKFHNGPDSAPHREEDKLCVCGCPGAFVSPTLGPMTVDLYDRNGKLDSPAFYAFTVENGARAFGIEVDQEDTFELVKKDWIVPKSYGDVLSFFGGRKLSWQPVEPAALNPELLLVA